MKKIVALLSTIVLLTSLFGYCNVSIAKEGPHNKYFIAEEKEPRVHGEEGVG